jgi:DNA primase
MAFSAHFLDEVRNKTGLVELVGTRVRLIKKGREYHGLCPFHNEKTPSFTINEDKGFYHCFGCGEHGSVFDFVMKTNNMSFPESVEHLAREVGLEIPVETPEERQRQIRAKNLFEVIEAATVHYETVLYKPEGKVALNYLFNRGISEASIKHFRIGFSSNSHNSVKTNLVREGISDQLMIEAGLLIQPDDSSRPSFDRFRGRVMFPITDRQGRVIAFGGRVLGEGEPKYLNSPETALFHKGDSLYALPQAVEAARDTKTILVTEGYTDVIALHQAGFRHAVAPLGTALTENQMQLLWKVVSEPILCFDGDNAGKKAARRAAERAMPLLKPEKSLKFISLPDGEDPDSLIKTRGIKGIAEVIEEAVHLFEVIWRFNTFGCRLETPEDRAGLENRLTEVAKTIKDQTVQRYYLNNFKNRLWDEFGKNRNINNFSWGRGNRSNKQTSFVQMAEKSGKEAHVDTIWIQQAILIVTLINHPLLFDRIGEQLASLEFRALDLDKLRQEVLKTLALSPRTKKEALRDHIENAGFSALLNGLLSQQVINHANFARPDENIDVAQNGWEQTLRLFRRNQLLVEIQAVEEELSENPTSETFELLKALKQTAMKKEDAEIYSSNLTNSKNA